MLGEVFVVIRQDYIPMPLAAFIEEEDANEYIQLCLKEISSYYNHGRYIGIKNTHLQPELEGYCGHISYHAKKTIVYGHHLMPMLCAK